MSVWKSVSRQELWCLKSRLWEGILSLKALGKILPCHFKLLVIAGNPKHSLFRGFITPNSASIFIWLPSLCLCLIFPSFIRTSVIKLLLDELSFLAILLPFAMLIFKCYLITLINRWPDSLLWSFSDHWSLVPTLLSQVISCVNSIGFVFPRSDLGCIKRFFQDVLQITYYKLWFPGGPPGKRSKCECIYVCI